MLSRLWKFEGDDLAVDFESDHAFSDCFYFCAGTFITGGSHFDLAAGGDEEGKGVSLFDDRTGQTPSWKSNSAGASGSRAASSVPRTSR